MYGNRSTVHILLIVALNGWLYHTWHWTCGLQLEDCALQLCRHSGTQHDYGMYLDLESTIDEQLEDLEGFSEK